MISLQAHNQVLYHLSQITSAFSTRSVPLVTKPTKNDTIQEKDTDDTCQSSFAEALKNYKESPIIDPAAFDPAMLSNKKNNTWIMWNYPSVLTLKISLEKSNKWRTSYVSGYSFAENKRDFPCSEVVEPIVLSAIISSTKNQRRLLHSLSRTSLPYNLQTRGFKTHRSIQAETERNTTISDRLKKFFRRPANKPNDILSYIKANNLTNSTNVSAEDAKLMDAVVRGYELGFQSQINARVRLKAINTLFIVVLITLVAWVTGIYKINSGSMLKGNVFNYRPEINPERINVTFNDVKGVQEAKEELQEIVQFLKNPQKFSKLGGKLPKGILLVGPPGTGKTLLARAVAGEAGVPFFYAGGPEFDEILVGQGARRVRDLFKSAKEKAPCVVFLDEIDSIGGKRTSSVLHPYANQTINQLLSEMDGFHKNEGVIILGATNRQDDLDRALMRPGRFDSKVYVGIPDFYGRREIFDLYLQNVLKNGNIDLDQLAQCTVGFTGADIQNMVNQAALRAAVEGCNCVEMRHMEYARDKVLIGPARKMLLLAQDVESRRLTAYHEGGHALVAYYTKDAKPLHKITIIPHGQSLGHTSYFEPKDRYHISKSELLAQLDSSMGGRAAEELVFGLNKVTTGAGQDLQQATRIAEEMVKMHGMSDKVGLRTYFHNDSKDYGPNTNELIDKEIKRILQESYDRAKTILKTHHEELKNIAEALLEHETLSFEDFKAIIAGDRTFDKYVKNKEPIIDVKPNNIM